MFIIPVKDTDRNDEIETKHVWIINVPLLMMEIKFVFPVVKKQLSRRMLTYINTMNNLTNAEPLLNFREKVASYRDLEFGECAYTST